MAGDDDWQRLPFEPPAARPPSLPISFVVLAELRPMATSAPAGST
jgi:hypothetical protein